MRTPGLQKASIYICTYLSIPWLYHKTISLTMHKTFSLTKHVLVLQSLMPVERASVLKQLQRKVEWTLGVVKLLMTLQTRFYPRKLHQRKRHYLRKILMQLKKFLHDHEKCIKAKGAAMNKFYLDRVLPVQGNYILNPDIHEHFVFCQLYFVAEYVSNSLLTSVSYLKYTVK